jgi:hypothetical protein
MSRALRRQTLRYAHYAIAIFNLEDPLTGGQWTYSSVSKEYLQQVGSFSAGTSRREKEIL